MGPEHDPSGWSFSSASDPTAFFLPPDNDEDRQEKRTPPRGRQASRFTFTSDYDERGWVRPEAISWAMPLWDFDARSVVVPYEAETPQRTGLQNVLYEASTGIERISQGYQEFADEHPTTAHLLEGSVEGVVQGLRGAFYWELMAGGTAVGVPDPLRPSATWVRRLRSKQPEEGHGWEIS